MNTKSYNVIFALLISSVVFILVLQGFWIRNFYIQKQDEFNSTVYSAMERISDKIEERKGIRKLQQNVSVQKSNIAINGQEHKTTVVNKSTVISNYAQVKNRDKTEDIKVHVGDVSSIQREMNAIKTGDSNVKVFSPNATIVTKTQTIQASGKPDELNKLMDKMLLEIKIVDNDERNSDTLNNIIRKVFENKGLLLPFEFALKKIYKNKDETLAKSKKFNEKEHSFVSDLSANKVFSSHNYLLVQFPHKDSFVFASIRNMLILSFIFSLVIIGTFYFTIRLILKQKKVNDIKSDFINNMTHELKTPIATISLATDAINNPQIRGNEAKFKDYTRILKEENLKLNSHVERVLEMAMLDKGELTLKKTPVNMGMLIHKSIDTYKLHIQKQNASINVDLDMEIICEVDEEHMHAVFNNLLENALKYSKEICTVNIKMMTALKDIIISFKDNGIGIDKEQKEKVFDKFFRVQRGNLHDVKGFGLGLAYVRSIVEAHDGTVELQSEKGKGSEFIIKLKNHA